ncbi:MAG: YigZ family protein [Bacteroidetes bacterium GWE2_39_28]|nr:MAG: YigZ family protein [Bacteroidetes bacterium GWE2_39_28]OFY11647.1 MAG: YigZ family protein [Bacteroidetes bacterium GWF2_39_10]OFZ11571.1 MAG: YigZ family protein [Bacteroidetes bacterium RIFOXYC2_FULL_39_11]HCT94758.1 YigZ family protein [Rikenellaceae bacterium]HCV15882.1 YigZ family protein [Rikenellaceae bacterium]
MSEIPAPDSYKSISSPSSGVYRDLGSKFISLAYPVSSEEEIKSILSAVKKEYFDARHHCYAYRLGQKGELWRVNDDGEPSSSAGRPILGQLLSNELSDILIVVVRYFGGTKLGIPGLIKAYKSAAADAIDKTKIVEKTATKELVVKFDYISTDTVMKMVRNSGAHIISQNFDLDCALTIRIGVSNAEQLKLSLQENGFSVSD